MIVQHQFMIDRAIAAAHPSPCRSRRGVALFDMAIGAFRGEGHNGPPLNAPCPGREVCAGRCRELAVHAEQRALRAAATYRAMGHPPGPYDLIHVELDAHGGVVACAGPTCLRCACEILDVGFVGGVWLYEDDVLLPGGPPPIRGQAWRRYTAEEFHRATLRNAGIAL